MRAVLGLGRGLNLPVLAEGVETSGELDFLNAEACSEVQGYLLGRPAPISEFAELIQRGETRGWTAAKAVPAERELKATA